MTRLCFVAQSFSSRTGVARGCRPRPSVKRDLPRLRQAGECSDLLRQPSGEHGTNEFVPRESWSTWPAWLLGASIFFGAIGVCFLLAFFYER